MKVYVLERDNPTCWEEPELFINPDKAIKKVKEEYESIKEEIGIESEIMDMGLDGVIGVLMKKLIQEQC